MGSYIDDLKWLIWVCSSFGIKVYISWIVYVAPLPCSRGSWTPPSSSPMEGAEIIYTTQDHQLKPLEISSLNATTVKEDARLHSGIFLHMYLHSHLQCNLVKCKSIIPGIVQYWSFLDRLTSLTVICRWTLFGIKIARKISRTKPRNNLISWQTVLGLTNRVVVWSYRAH